MKYASTKAEPEAEVDVATATPEQLLDAYESLLAKSVFPARTAKDYADRLRALIAARPDVLEYHRRLAAPARTARLGCTCPPKRS